MQQKLDFILQKHRPSFFPIIQLPREKKKLHALDFSISNSDLTEDLLADTGNFSRYISSKLQSADSMFGIGGYNEDRRVYRRSSLFGTGETARSLHLGIDIWGPVGTPVFAPLGGMVHSFAFNNNFGDYGATIILQHSLDNVAFYTLYGHLSLADLATMRKGKFVTRAEMIGHFGPAEENGNWPPHVHFQIIKDIGFLEGDYPGVCDPAAAEKFLQNCPDPSVMLNFDEVLRKQ